MLKKTLIASAVTVAFALSAQGVQANPITNLVSGLVNDVATVQFDARRGGARRSSSASKSYSSKKTTSSTASKTNANTNQQKDAQFSQNAATGRTNTANNAQPGAQAAAPTGGMGMGANFMSSLAGAGAGVLLANMLLSPSAAASQGTEIATPDMLSDAQIDECLTQIKSDIEAAKQQLADAAPEDQAALRDQISKMNDLQITLLSEQLNRMQKGS